MNYTSLSFTSNVVFYEPVKSIGFNKQDMYITTNQLQQSKSVERIPKDLRYTYINESKSPVRPVRSNNNHKANMTTIDTEFGRTISDIYKDRLGIGQYKQIQPTQSSPKIENINCKKQDMYQQKIVANRTRIEPQKVSEFNEPKNKTFDGLASAPNLNHMNQEKNNYHEEEAANKQQRTF